VKKRKDKARWKLDVRFLDNEVQTYTWPDEADDLKIPDRPSPVEPRTLEDLRVGFEVDVEIKSKFYHGNIVSIDRTAKASSASIRVRISSPSNLEDQLLRWPHDQSKIRVYPPSPSSSAKGASKKRTAHIEEARSDNTSKRKRGQEVSNPTDSKPAEVKVEPAEPDAVLLSKEEAGQRRIQLLDRMKSHSSANRPKSCICCMGVLKSEAKLTGNDSASMDCGTADQPPKETGDAAPKQSEASADETGDAPLKQSVVSADERDDTWGLELYSDAIPTEYGEFHVHQLCLVSAQPIREGFGKLVGSKSLDAALNTGCQFCGGVGATVTCSASKCKRSVHLNCARKADWYFIEEVQPMEFLCPIHSSSRSKAKLVKVPISAFMERWCQRGYCPACLVIYPEDEGLMVECNHCEMWVHSKCAGLDKADLEWMEDMGDAAQWYCQACEKEGHVSTKRPPRSRMVTKGPKTYDVDDEKKMLKSQADKFLKLTNDLQQQTFFSEASSSAQPNKSSKSSAQPGKSSKSGKASNDPAGGADDSWHEAGYVDAVPIVLSWSSDRNEDELCHERGSTEICANCGSFTKVGDESVLACIDCGEVYHTYCLQTAPCPGSEWRDIWRCPQCKVCSVCASGHETILVCDSCDRGFHASCLKLTKDTDEGTWLCVDCLVCVNCHRRPDRGRLGHDTSKWDHLFPLCPECSAEQHRGNHCPVCFAVVTEWDHEEASGKATIECNLCGKFVHAKCDQLDDDELEGIRLTSSVYLCPCCRPYFSTPGEWRKSEKNMRNAVYSLMYSVVEQDKFKILWRNNARVADIERIARRLRNTVGGSKLSCISTLLEAVHEMIRGMVAYEDWCSRGSFFYREVNSLKSRLPELVLRAAGARLEICPGSSTSFIELVEREKQQGGPAAVTEATAAIQAQDDPLSATGRRVTHKPVKYSDEVGAIVVDGERPAVRPKVKQPMWSVQPESDDAAAAAGAPAEAAAADAERIPGGRKDSHSCSRRQRHCVQWVHVLACVRVCWCVCASLPACAPGVSVCVCV
jgi:hypothetical protein